MSRENTYLSIILKKQPYGEADELVTVFTRELGKVRILAKSAKSAKSKLQYGLQALFLTKLTLTKSILPKVIGVETQKTFAGIREDLHSVNVAYYALELLLKFTPDEQKNDRLFNTLEEFLGFLSAASCDQSRIDFGLAKFKIDFLESIGLAVHAEPPADIVDVGFSNSRGGFMFAGDAADYRRLSLGVFRQFERLRAISFDELLRAGNTENNIYELQEILSGFLEYHLERQLKSERFL